MEKEEFKTPNYPKMIKAERKEFNFWENIEEELDNQFPKGECKERGQALVLFAHFHLQFKEFIKRLKEVISNTILTKKGIKKLIQLEINKLVGGRL